MTKKFFGTLSPARVLSPTFVCGNRKIKEDKDRKRQAVMGEYGTKKSGNYKKVPKTNCKAQAHLPLGSLLPAAVDELPN